MTTYYLYFLDSQRRIHARENVEAANDAAAMALAEDMWDGRAMELWCGARIVWTREMRSPDA